MKRLTILDFFEWAIRQMNASDLSSLMLQYGYTRDDAETVLQAFDDNKAGFVPTFKKILFAGLERPKTYFEENREQGEMTAYDWIKYAKETGLTLATGETTTTTTTGTTTGKKTALDYILEIFGEGANVAESIWGGKAAGQYLEEYRAQTNAERSARQTTTIMIALVVIVIIVAAAVIMTRKK